MPHQYIKLENHKKKKNLLTSDPLMAMSNSAQRATQVTGAEWP
jgi:hypothetical protein